MDITSVQTADLPTAKRNAAALRAIDRIG
jgi:hypothetical protein